MTKDQAFEQMRDALELMLKWGCAAADKKARAALAAAKAVEPQPERQPLTDEQRIQNLADLTRWLDGLGSNIHTYSLRGIALAAWEAHSKAVEPQPDREWVELTPAEIDAVSTRTQTLPVTYDLYHREYARRISSALREKNGGQ